MKENLLIYLLIHISDLHNSLFNGDFTQAIECFSRNIYGSYNNLGYKCTICKINSMVETTFYRSFLVVFTDYDVEETQNSNLLKNVIRSFQDKYSLPCYMDVTVR